MTIGTAEGLPRQQLAFALAVAFLAWVPVPFGSNRPFFWAFNAALVAAAALIRAATLRGAAPLPLAAFRVPGALFGAGFVWLLVQLAPLPAGLDPGGPWSNAAEALGRALVPRISVDPAATLHMLVRWASYALFFYLVAQLAAGGRMALRLLRAVFWVIVVHAAGALLALYALGDTILLMPKWAYEGVATGTFINRNSFATFMAFGLAIGVALCMDMLVADEGRAGAAPERAASAAVYAAGTGLVASALLLSASRMGIAAGLCGAVTAAALMLRGAPVLRRGGVAVAASAAILAGALLAFSGRAAIGRLASLGDAAEVRLELYRQVWTMVLARPFTGFGGGTFADAFQLFHRLPVSADVGWDSAHNLYLELLADLGVLGMAPVLAAGAIVAGAIGCLRRREPVVHVAAIAVAVVAALHSLVDFSLRIEANVFVFMAVLALSFGRSAALRAASVAPSRGRAPGDEGE